MLMARYIGISEQHAGELPEGFIEMFTGLHSSYIDNRKAQLGLIGATDGNRWNVAEKRRAVVKQVTKNLLTLAIDFLDKPEMVKAYFDQSIVRRPVKKKAGKPAPEVFSEAVPPETKAVIIHGGFEAGTSFHIVNTGSVTIKIYTANLPNDVVPSNALELAPGEEDDVLGSQLGADSNLFLMAYNPDKATTGSYEVSIEI